MKRLITLTAIAAAAALVAYNPGHVITVIFLCGVADAWRNNFYEEEDSKQ